jgi:transposase
MKALEGERDEYKRLYVALLEAFRKLEAGLTRHHRERFAESGEQSTLALMEMLTGQATEASPPPASEGSEVAAHTRAKPTGRKPLPESLPRITLEVLPLEVQKGGLDAFERIGEDVTETVERRAASFVVVQVVRPKYVPKQAQPAGAAGESPRPVVQGPLPELPLPRALAGPGLLADSIVKRFQDHLPLHRMERIYGREGLPLARSTVCGWHQEVASLVSPLTEAMLADALQAPYLCTDATGVLVQDAEKCRTGHFFVLVAPGKHVLFRYTPKHNRKAVDSFLAGYKGYLLADAHSVYEHLYSTGDIIEAGCWAHARRYFYKALESDSSRARHALSLIQQLFKLEAATKALPPQERLRLRHAFSRPVVADFYSWCDEEALKVLDETPISKAIGYARNQRQALSRFLEDGRLPIHNNISENALRREALGRKNWLFLGNDEGGTVNATLVTLLASCQLHGVEPLGYLRDLLCLLPGWPAHHILQLYVFTGGSTAGSECDLY